MAPKYIGNAESVMNICQVVLSNGWGGAETVVYEISKYLRDKGHEVSIVLNQAMLKYYSDLEGVTLFDIGPLLNSVEVARALLSSQHRPHEDREPRNRAALMMHYYSIELLALLQYKKIHQRLLQFISDKHIDVLHAHLEPSIVLLATLKDARVPRVATLHGEYYLRGMLHLPAAVRPLVLYRRWRFDRVLRAMDKVTHVSNYFMMDSVARWEGLRGDKSLVIRNGIDVTEVKESPRFDGRLKGNFNLLFPGGSKPAKGGDLLVEALALACKEAPDVHLYIALEVPAGHPLRRKVRDLGVEQKVTFVGTLLKQDYWSLLRAMDVLVMPSKQEAFGIVYLEAMALGRPVVATRVGGIPEVVQDRRNGILVEQDRYQLAQALLELYGNDNLRQEIGENNLRDVGSFDWGSAVDRYVELYEEISMAG